MDDFRVRATHLSIAVSVGTLLVSLSCAPAEQGATGPRHFGPLGGGEAREAAPPRPGEHWVQDERLRVLVADISRHAGQWPDGARRDPDARQVTPAQAEADAAFAEAAALAQGLAEAASRIPRSVADHPMSAEDRRGFAAESERLRQQALTIRRAAKAGRAEPLRRAYTQVGATCASCHGQYKEFAGELGPG